MATCLYLMGNTVRAVIGRSGTREATVQRTAQMTFEYGCIINGIVTDEEAFKSQISGFWERNDLPKKDVTLVINSTEIASKAVSIPKAAMRHPIEFLSQTFAESGREEAMVYDYINAGAARGSGTAVDIIGMQCPQAFVEYYVNLFSDIGIKIKHVTTALSSIVKLMQKLPFGDEPCILQIIDGDSLMSVLWVNGKYAYSQRIRLFSDAGSDGLGRELAHNVDSLLQFYTTMHMDIPLRRVLMWETDDSRFETYRNAVSTLGVIVDRYQHDGIIIGNSANEGEILYCAGALLSAKKDIDFMDGFDETEKPEKKETSMVLYILIAVLPLVFCIASTLLLSYGNLVTSFEIDDIETYLTAETTVHALAQVDETEAEIIALQDAITAVTAANDAIASYPLMDTSVRDAILACRTGGSSLYLTDYYAATGRLLFTASVQEPGDASKFIALLEKTGLFRDVNYLGYELMTDIGEYAVNVECYLNGTAGR